MCIKDYIAKGLVITKIKSSSGVWTFWSGKSGFPVPDILLDRRAKYNEGVCKLLG